MSSSGGLKLTLQRAGSRDRRWRFAHVRLSKVGVDEVFRLVTDAEGRMRYRLPAGEYRLSVLGGPHVRFAVHDHRWTTVRLSLA